MMKRLCTSSASAALALAVLALGSARGDGVKVSAVGGAVMLPDNQTLVVSLAADATLLYIDTAGEKESKRVQVEFQPAALAAQGDKLFAAAKGTSTVHVCDAASGKELKIVKLPGEPILALACHPSKGLVYASNQSCEVFSIDPEQGTATKTKAKGQMLAVDPVDGGFVYSGVQKPIRDVLVLQQAGAGQITVSFAKADARAVMLKSAVDDQDLKPTAANDNAALNGRWLAVSPDGKQVAMAGGGGWHSKTDAKFHYVVAVFDASDLQGMNGQVETGPYPAAVAFHPVLPLGVALASDLTVFSTKSFAKKESFKPQKGGAAAYLGFGAKGTKVVYLPAGDDALVQFFPLQLTDQDRETLNQAFSK
ncbi:MAG TPA: hypothetical protein VMS17_30040 [Gemmataceae bacterium]|nr:hypothetical protein [Gemmataceae bacterium]